MQLFIKLTTSFTTGFYSALNHLDHGGLKSEELCGPEVPDSRMLINTINCISSFYCAH